jgi:hypothetical protein
MPVFKTVLQVTVLHEANSMAEAADNIAAMPLTDIAYELDDGQFIGRTVPQPPVELSFDDLRSELMEIGNDGTFFDEN